MRVRRIFRNSPRTTDAGAPAIITALAIEVSPSTRVLLFTAEATTVAITMARISCDGDPHHRAARLARLQRQQQRDADEDRAEGALEVAGSGDTFEEEGCDQGQEEPAKSLLGAPHASFFAVDGGIPANVSRRWPRTQAGGLVAQLAGFVTVAPTPYFPLLGRRRGQPLGVSDGSRYRGRSAWQDVDRPGDHQSDERQRDQ